VRWLLLYAADGLRLFALNGGKDALFFLPAVAISTFDACAPLFDVRYHETFHSVRRYALTPWALRAQMAFLFFLVGCVVCGGKGIPFVAEHFLCWRLGRDVFLYGAFVVAVPSA